MPPDADSHRVEARSPGEEYPANSAAIVCPICGAATVQEKCKVICKSEICRGRVIMNCAEF